MSNLKLIGLRSLVAVAGPLLPRLLTSRVCVYMLHRFAVPELGIAGHSPAALRNSLAELRRAGVAMLSLDDVVQRITSGRANELKARPTVVFTVDDGYWDMLEVGAPVFAEFDCPYTGFVVPGSITSGACFWWDEVERMLRLSRQHTLLVERRSERTSYSWNDEPSRIRAYDLVCVALKTVPNSERLALMDDISRQTDVPLLAAAAQAQRVCSWDELRRAERAGYAQFGAHTMTHPILSRCDDAEAAWEIEASVQQLREAVTRPSSVFCYPNGLPSDFGDREIDVVQRLGLTAAVSTRSATVRPDYLQEGWNSMRWAIPRVSCDARPGASLRTALLP